MQKPTSPQSEGKPKYQQWMKSVVLVGHDSGFGINEIQELEKDTQEIKLENTKITI